MSSAPRYRFAPSPTGFFHVGGARTALFNWALAKRTGGAFVLRIEDTDEARNRPEWTEGIIDALDWIGIHRDDPTFEGPYYQSHYVAAHEAAAKRLFEAGAAYYCDLTPEQIQERAKETGASGYDGYSRDRGLGPGPGRVLRFRVPEGTSVVHDLVRGDVTFDHSTIEDFVLLRSNGSPIFNLANVVDDIEMGITNVVRAEEHLPNTPKQQLLWQALGHTPPVWAHVPLLVNEQRKKLSKRRDKVALEQYREEGILAVAMINYLMTLGWSPPGDEEIVPWSVIQESFRLEDVNHSPAFFDIRKLTAFNGEYIRRMSVDEFMTACQPFLEARAPWPADRFDPAKFRALAPAVQSRANTLAEVPGVVDFVFLAEPVVDEQDWAKTMSAAGSDEMLADVTKAYTELPEWRADLLKETLETIGERHGLKKGKAQAPIRVAVTGRAVGPPLFDALEVMGREEVVRRLTVARSR